MKLFQEKTLDETQVATKSMWRGNLLDVWKDTVKLPNGNLAAREYIKHQGAVGILPVLPDGSLVFVKQCRYAINSVIYEIPAGKLEKGEEPLTCAQRELSEETGYEASHWEKLTSIVTTPGFSNEVIHLYVATGLTLKAQHPDPDEFVEVVSFTPKEVKKMVLQEELFDAKSLAALLLYLYKNA